MKNELTEQLNTMEISIVSCIVKEVHIFVILRFEPRALHLLGKLSALPLEPHLLLCFK
jgi:hypothetical protein